MKCRLRITYLPKYRLKILIKQIENLRVVLFQNSMFEQQNLWFQRKITSE